MSYFVSALLAITSIPMPANFECDLLLISTSRHIVEWDQNMAWMTAVVAPEYSSAKIPAQQAEEARAAIEAAQSLNIRTVPAVIMDGAALSTSHYDSSRQKKLNILASLGDGKQRKGSQMYPYSVPVAHTGTTRGGNLLAGFYFGPNTTAKGPKPGKNESWPTFYLSPIQEQVDQGFSSPYSDARRAANRALALNLSTLSVSETAELIDKSSPSYNQICICAWGTQIPGRPNLITFPPNGRAVHYKFGHKDGKWFAKFVKAFS